MEDDFFEDDFADFLDDFSFLTMTIRNVSEMDPDSKVNWKKINSTANK